MVNGVCCSEEDDGITGSTEDIDDKSNGLFKEDTYVEPSKVLYDCYAISNHSGTLGGGHYTAYCRHPLSSNHCFCH